MGTMKGWGGSGGKWNGVRDLSEELLDLDEVDGDETDEAGEEKLDELIDAVIDALGDGSVDDEDGGWSVPLPLPVGSSWSNGPRARGGGGGADGPGAGGGAIGGGGCSGGVRSRARAAGVGGAVLAAALAIREEDAKTLSELGLNLEELSTLGNVQRNNAILNALIGADGGIEDAELRRVGARVLTAVLKEGLDAANAVRRYIVEYCVRVWANETGERQRAEAGRAKSSHALERQLHAALMARAKRIDIAPGSGRGELQGAIEESLGLMRGLTEGV